MNKLTAANQFSLTRNGRSSFSVSALITSPICSKPLSKCNGVLPHTLVRVIECARIRSLLS
jgi:hypothetical protein